jgi:hypothetical protein
VHPTTTIGPPGLQDQLAVTFKCSEGHHDIRFYRTGPVPRTVMCANCGAVAAIGASEYERHRDLMTPLAEWVVQ